MSIAQKHFRIGFELYIACQPIEACQHPLQRRGWLAANAAEGEFVSAPFINKASR